MVALPIYHGGQRHQFGTGQKWTLAGGPHYVKLGFRYGLKRSVLVRQNFGPPPNGPVSWGLLLPRLPKRSIKIMNHWLPNFLSPCKWFLLQCKLFPASSSNSLYLSFVSKSPHSTASSSYAKPITLSKEALSRRNKLLGLPEVSTRLD